MNPLWTVINEYTKLSYLTENVRTKSKGRGIFNISLQLSNHENVYIYISSFFFFKYLFPTYTVLTWQYGLLPLPSPPLFLGLEPRGQWWRWGRGWRFGEGSWTQPGCSSAPQPSSQDTTCPPHPQEHTHNHTHGMLIQRTLLIHYFNLK